MAERSKALRSGRSPLLWAWVRIPLLTRPFRGDINFQQEIFWKRYQETASDHLRKVSLYSSLKQDGRTRTLYEVSDSNCILNWVLRHPPPFAKHHLTGGTWPHGVKNHWCIKCLSALQTSSKNIVSPTGNRIPVSRVTGGDTYHYTIEDWRRLQSDRRFESHARVTLCFNML